MARASRFGRVQCLFGKKGPGAKSLDPKSVREYLNDGSYGGLYQRSDDEMVKIWLTAVEETRELLSEDWD